MTRQNAQSIAPSFPPVTSSQIVDTDPQLSLPVGPTGRVHRGGKSALPDNTQFWKTVNAVEFSSRGVTRQQVFRTVAWFASLTDKRVCFASVESLAKKARLGTTATRAQLRALERDGYIETDGQRSGGRSATRYRLSTLRVSVPNPTLSVAQPNAERCVNPTLSVAYKEIEEGTEVQEVQRTVSKLTEFPHKRADTGQTKQQRMVAAICWKLDLPDLEKLDLHDLLTAAGLEDFDGLENSEKQVLIKRLREAEARHDRRVARDAAPNGAPAGKKPKKTKGKTQSPAPNGAPAAESTPGRLRPDPPPMKPELRRDLEADARAKGFIPVGDRWLKVR